MENDKCTSHVQQGYNTPLTWGGPHALWDPPHVRGVLYTCCTCDVRESPLNVNIDNFLITFISN